MPRVWMNRSRLALPPLLAAASLALLAAGHGIVPAVLALAALHCLGLPHAVAWSVLVVAGSLPMVGAWSPSPLADVLALCGAMALSLVVHARASRAPAPPPGDALEAVAAALAAAAQTRMPLTLVACEGRRPPRRPPPLAPLVRTGDAVLARPDGGSLLVLPGMDRRGAAALLGRLEPLALRAGVVLVEDPEGADAGELIAQAERARRAAREAQRSVVYAG